MKAQVGDYIKYDPDYGFHLFDEVPFSKTRMSKVIGVEDQLGEEVYLTNAGDYVSELQLEIDDIFLASEMEHN